MVINLAATGKYYSWPSKSVLRENGFQNIEYWHRPIPGRTIPDFRLIMQVLWRMHKKFQEQPGKLIVIHCIKIFIVIMLFILFNKILLLWKIFV